MGAPLGNCNACKGYKGWYKRSMASKELKSIASRQKYEDYMSRKTKRTFTSSIWRPKLKRR